MVTEKLILKTEAVFSDDGKHRYLLSKEWDKTKKSAMVIMKNPNNADILSLDLTTMCVLNNVYALGFGAVHIVNLYSIKTDKLSLRDATHNLIGSENDDCIKKYADKSDSIILACGSILETSKQVQNRYDELMNVLMPHKDKMYLISDNNGHVGLHPLSPSIRNRWILKSIKEVGSKN